MTILQFNVLFNPRLKETGGSFKFLAAKRSPWRTRRQGGSLVVKIWRKSTRTDDRAHRSVRPGDSIVAHRRHAECIINDLRAGEFCIANATRGKFARTYVRTYVCMRARVSVPGMKKKMTRREKGGTDRFDKRRESFGFADDDDDRNFLA